MMKLQQQIHQQWGWLTEGVLHQAIRRTVISLATRSAQNPKRMITFVTLLSIGLAVAGFNTNFEIVYDQDKIFTPFESYPALHNEWIQQESGFEQIRPFILMLHNDGDNVLTAKSVRRLFQAYDTMRQTEGLQEACAQSQFRNAQNEPDCRVWSATQYWNHDEQFFQDELASKDTEQHQDAYIVDMLSNDTFPDGTPVFHESIMGNYVMKNRTTVVFDLNMEQDSSLLEKTLRLESAQSLIVKLDIPDLEEQSDLVENRMLERMGQLAQQWKDEDAVITLEYFTTHAYSLEFEAAIFSDMPLVMIMFAIMVSFCCFVYTDRYDKVQSRSMMGLFSILSIALSLASGYGTVWIFGIPFTNISLMIPFIVVGVGLDDTFIITGAYFRKSHQTNIVKRVEETMDEVGLSIWLTTTTTMLAFCLGCASSVPAIRWLCIYGCATILFVFLYQCTFFIAWLVLDERRVQANKRDCCVCFTVPDDKQETDENDEDDADDDDDDVEQEAASSSNNSDTGNESSSLDEFQSPTKTKKVRNSYKKELPKNFSERFMGWYADQLLRPTVKIIVLIAFAAYMGLTIYTTTNLTQKMDVEDFVPAGSFVRTFLLNFEEYSSLFRPIGIYFRNVDQSDPVIQQQMLDYVDEISSLEQVGSPPPFFWLRDMKEMVEDPDSDYADYNLQDYTFDQQVEIALSLSQIRDVYGGDIVRDPETGEITASRTFTFLRGMVDKNTIKDQIQVLMDQREVTMAQPVNQDKDKDDLAFFAFDDLFFFWELYAVSVNELIFTTVTGVGSVSAVAFLLIPHWSAALFVCGTIIMVYIMLLGTMQMAGLHINVVTYIVIVMAIGLLVDFLMHILLRYYETTGTTRDAKVKETLETMGSSILLGGLTTWLGVIPLAFSTTAIFKMVFVSFMAMVSLGCGVGLILLPVLLSLVGPVVSVQPGMSSKSIKNHKLRQPETPDTTQTPSFPSSVTSQEQSSDYSSQAHSGSDTTPERQRSTSIDCDEYNDKHMPLPEVRSDDTTNPASPRGRTVYTIEIADSKDCPIGIECGRGLGI